METEKSMIKQQQIAKIDKFLAKCEAKKSAAADSFKLGQYGEAVKHYKTAAEMLESAIEDFPLWKQELTSVEATIFNNMAACCKKELNSKMEIEYTTKVIDRQNWIADKTLLVKAYLRRGLAYEQIEKFLPAKEDMLTVKQLQADNKQASQCLHRVNKAIKDVYGDKIPEQKKNQPVKMAAPSSTPVQTPKKEETPKVNLSELSK